MPIYRDDPVYIYIQGRQAHHNTFDALKASMVTGFADIEAFREQKVLLGLFGKPAR